MRGSKLLDRNYGQEPGRAHVRREQSTTMQSQPDQQGVVRMHYEGFVRLESPLSSKQ